MPEPVGLALLPGPEPVLPVSGVTPSPPVALLCVLVPGSVTPGFGAESVGSPAPGPLVIGSGLVPELLGSAAGGVAPPQAMVAQATELTSASVLILIIARWAAGVVPDGGLPIEARNLAFLESQSTTELSREDASRAQTSCGSRW